MDRKPSIMSVLWIMLFDHTCLNMTFPILTLLFFDTASRLFLPDTSHAVRSMWYGVCVAIPHIMNIVVTPLLSSLSDNYGRKNILLIGTLGAFLFAVTAACGIFFGLLNLLLLGRIIQGAFSRTNPIAQAIVGDISTKENKVLYMGYLQCAISLGAFLGPIFGGYLANRFWFAELNFSLPYWVAGIFAIISFLLTVLFFQETLKQPTLNKQYSYVEIKKLFMRPAVLFTSLILLLSQMSWSLYYQFIPPVLKTMLHFDAHQLGLFVGLIAFWLAIATGIGIRLLHRLFNLRQILIFSLYLVFFGSVASALCCYLPASLHASWLMWIAAIPTAVGDVIAYSCLITVYSNAVEKEQQGKIMGICFIIVALVWALAGMAGGVMMSFYALLPLLVAPLGILLAMLLVHSSKSNTFLLL